MTWIRCRPFPPSRVPPLLGVGLGVEGGRQRQPEGTQEQPRYFGDSPQPALRRDLEIQVRDQPPVPAHIVHEAGVGPVGPIPRAWPPVVRSRAPPASALVVSWNSRVLPGKKISRRAVRLERPNGIQMRVVFDPEGDALAVLGEEGLLPGGQPKGPQPPLPAADDVENALADAVAARSRGKREVSCSSGCRRLKAATQGPLVDRVVHGGSWLVV